MFHGISLMMLVIIILFYILLFDLKVFLKHHLFLSCIVFTGTVFAVVCISWLAQLEHMQCFTLFYSSSLFNPGILTRKLVKKKRWKHQKSCWFLPLMALLTASFKMKIEQIVLFNRFLRLNFFEKKLENGLSNSCTKN